MTARGLPPALREAAAQFARGITPAELATRAAALSENYRERAGSQGIARQGDVAAYLTARMPATYAAMSAALDWTLERLDGFAPASVLDIGAGPGTASWAAAEIFPGLENFTLIDRNRHLLAAARALAAADRRLIHANIAEGDIAALPEGSSADLVLAGYAFAELPGAQLSRAVSALWAATKSVAVIVEPGTPDGYARIRKCRDALLALGAHIVAPCPGAYACPIEGADWCHFAVRLPRSRAHLRAKAASVPFEDEKFSYLAVARDTVALRPATARILAQPHVLKHALRLKLCGDGKITGHEAAKRDKAGYATFARKDWGDAV